MISKQSTFIIITTCLLLSILLIFLLYGVANYTNNSEHGFIRRFPPHSISLKSEFDIQYNSYYIAGLSSDNIYLGNVTAHNHVLTANYTLADTQHIKLPVTFDKKIAWSGMRVNIDSPYIYMLEGITPTFLHCSFQDTTMSLSNLDNIKFNAFIPLSPSSLLLRTYSNELRQNILTKIVLNPAIVKTSTFILEKQLDGVFCTDGMLLQDPKVNRLVYIYYYRNQFVCLDRDLNLIYNGKTIDDTNIAQIEIATITSENKTTLSSPPSIVNKRSCLSNNRIFVNSLLRSTNESEKSFNKSSVIDIYSLDNGEYQFSFYLPKYKNKKITDFKVYDNILVALYDHYLLVFHLNI